MVVRLLVELLLGLDITCRDRLLVGTFKTTIILLEPDLVMTYNGCIIINWIIVHLFYDSSARVSIEPG